MTTEFVDIHTSPMYRISCELAVAAAVIVAVSSLLFVYLSATCFRFGGVRMAQPFWCSFCFEEQSSNLTERRNLREKARWLKRIQSGH